MLKWMCLLLALLGLSACGSGGGAVSTAPSPTPVSVSQPSPSPQVPTDPEEPMLKITVNGHTFLADFEDNRSAAQFRDLLAQGPLTVEMADYGGFVGKTWEYCFDRLNPQPVTPLYSPEKMKAVMANYFRKSYVSDYKLKFNSGHGLRCSDCVPVDHVQVGFCGRVLLNAFNAIEYGEATGQQDLVKIGNEIFDSFLANGLTAKGYFYDDLHMRNPMPADKDVVHSIRQQSEAAYAVMHYLKYEKNMSLLTRPQMVPLPQQESHDRLDNQSNNSYQHLR